MDYKDYKAIYEIFKDIEADAAKAITEAYSEERKAKYTAVDAVVALARSDGLTDAEMQEHVYSRICEPKPPLRDCRSAYEKAKDAVYASGNKWAIENFHATHD